MPHTDQADTGPSVALNHGCDHLPVLHRDRDKGFSEVYNGSGEPVWEQIRHKSVDGRQRAVSLMLLCRIATLCPPRLLAQVRPFPVFVSHHDTVCRVKMFLSILICIL